MSEMALRSARAGACAPVSSRSLGTHWVSFVYVHIKMGRSRFPGKPLKFQNRKRISVLSGAVYHETAPDNHPPARGGSNNDFVGEKEVQSLIYFNLLTRIHSLHKIILTMCKSCVYVITNEYEAPVVWEKRQSFHVLWHFDHPFDVNKSFNLWKIRKRHKNKWIIVC